MCQRGFLSKQEKDHGLQCLVSFESVMRIHVQKSLQAFVQVSKDEESKRHVIHLGSS
jgi:hypothetical protein